MENVNEVLEVQDEELESNVRFNLGQVNDMCECLTEYRRMEELRLSEFERIENETRASITKITLKTIDDLLEALDEENQRYENMAMGI